MIDPHCCAQTNPILALVGQSLTDVIAKVWPPGRLHEYLLAPDPRRHTWNCWLHVRGQQQVGDGVYEFLSSSRNSDIITDCLGNCPPGLIKAFGKLKPQVRRANVYTALWGVLGRRDRLSRFVHHMKAVDDDTIIALSLLPNDPASMRLTKRLLQRSIDPRLLNEFVWVSTRLRQIVPEFDVDQAIIHSGDPVTGICKVVADLPFPNPPWPINGDLYPITAFEDLSAAGFELRNCLREGTVAMEAVFAIQTGNRYYYRWNGRQPALVSFSRAGYLGWVLREAWGFNNERLTQVTLNEIRAVLRTIDAVCPVNLEPRSGSMLSHLVGFMPWVEAEGG